MAEFAAAYTADPHGAVDALTERIDQRLDRVVLQAENAELLRGIPAVAAWTAPQEPQTLEEQHARAAELLLAHQRLRTLDPSLRVSNLKDWLPIGRPEDLTQFAEGLRLAGLPE